MWILFYIKTLQNYRKNIYFDLFSNLYPILLHIKIRNLWKCLAPIVRLPEVCRHRPLCLLGSLAVDKTRYAPPLYHGCLTKVWKTYIAWTSRNLRWMLRSVMALMPPLLEQVPRPPRRELLLGPGVPPAIKGKHSRLKLELQTFPLPAFIL